MRISDWSSDVCSSDLLVERLQPRALLLPLPLRRQGEVGRGCPRFGLIPRNTPPQPFPAFAGEGPEDDPTRERECAKTACRGGRILQQGRGRGGGGTGERGEQSGTRGRRGWKWAAARGTRARERGGRRGGAGWGE